MEYRMVATTANHFLMTEQIAQYHRDGFYIARGLFSAEEVAVIRETFMAQAANGPVEGLSEFRHNGRDAYAAHDPLARYPRMMHPHRHPDKPVGPLAMRYMLDQRVRAVLADLLADEPLAAQSMFYFKPAGARGQDLHQDNFYLRVKPFTCMAAWTAIDDADAENGALAVVPGSHNGELACPEKADSIKFFTTEHVNVPLGMREELAILKAGDVLFFSGSLIHGSYPNVSKVRFRRALICHYVPAGCIEVSQGYRPLLTFDGQEVMRQPATGGGPCGTLQNEADQAPH